MHYFVSDIHLGGGGEEEAKRAERLFVGWLDSVVHSAESIFICGDLFDFWFEYKRVVPKGFVRTLGRLATLADKGVRVVLVVGNHDLWVRDYFAEECGVEVYTTPQIFEIEGRKIYVAHGDNLNIKGSPMLRFMNNSFRSKWLRFLFSSLVHPDLALKLGQWWSRSSRAKHSRHNHKGKGKSIASLVEHSEMVNGVTPADYFIFGHLHTLERRTMEGGSEVIFIDDWSGEPHFAAMSKEGKITIEKV